MGNRFHGSNIFQSGDKCFCVSSKTVPSPTFGLRQVIKTLFIFPFSPSRNFLYTLAMNSDALCLPTTGNRFLCLWAGCTPCLLQNLSHVLSYTFMSLPMCSHPFCNPFFHHLFLSCHLYHSSVLDFTLRICAMLA